ncbi:MAG: hypothetical protein ACPGXZ_13305 [Saprospiraceae bacterium]
MKSYYLFLLLLLFSACEKEIEVEEFKLNLTEIAFSDIEIDCSPNLEGITIDSDAAYQAFQNENEMDCQSNFPAIDFTTNTVLGIKKDIGGCSLKNKYWNVYEDKSAKKYIFQAIAESEGNCYMLLSVPFWVSIPKLPSDYTVEFVEYEY